jgi:hypothetical protein
MNFYACKGTHTLFTGLREREKGGEGGREREREREKVREKKRERCRIWLFLFLIGMTGALAPFSYLVSNIMGYLNVENLSIGARLIDN